MFCGSLGSGRTSLLFQYAYSSSLETRRVLFITSQRKSYAHPPTFPKGVTPDPEVLHRIRMKYCDSYGSLLTYLAHFHLMESLPEVIVLDGWSFACEQIVYRVIDFSEFFSSLGADKSDAMAHTLALLRDAADFVSSVLYVLLYVCSLYQYSLSSARDAKPSEPHPICGLVVGDIDNGIHRAGIHHPDRWLPVHLRITCMYHH